MTPTATATAPQQFTAPGAAQQTALTNIGGGVIPTQQQSTDAVTQYAQTHNLSPEMVQQFVAETGEPPSDNLFEWAQNKGYWNGQSGANEQWTWHKTLGDGRVASQGATGVYGDPTKGYTIQPQGNTEDILRKMLTTPDYGLGTIQGNGVANALAAGLNSGTIGQTLQQAMQQAFGAQDWTKSDTANYNDPTAWVGQASTDAGGALKGFIGDTLANRMRWVNEANQDQNTLINQNLRSLQGQLYGGVGSTPGGQYRQATDSERYLAALPSLNKIVGRNFLNQSGDTQQFLLGAYEQPGAAGNENGYSGNDVLDAIKAGLPKFSAPGAGTIRY